MFLFTILNIIIFLNFHVEYLRRPPIDRTSKLVENIIKANETKRVKSYFEAGCINTHDGVHSISKCKCSCFLLLLLFSCIFGISWINDAVFSMYCEFFFWVTNCLVHRYIYIYIFGYLWRVINVLVRKSKLIQVGEMKKSRGRPKITLEEVTKKDLSIKEVIENITSYWIEWRKKNICGWP